MAGMSARETGAQAPRGARNERPRRDLYRRRVLGNPGPGGQGAILVFNGVERELSGGEALTTNNRMEMTAALEALNALKRPCAVDLFTDSQYVMQGITSWLPNWKRRGWKTADNKPVKNVELSPPSTRRPPATG